MNGHKSEYLGLSSNFSTKSFLKTKQKEVRNETNANNNDGVTRPDTCPGTDAIYQRVHGKQ